MEEKTMLNTKQLAEFLQINEKHIPAVKVTGKWLFPKHLSSNGSTSRP